MNKKISIRTKFVEDFSEDLAKKLELCAEEHSNDVNSRNKGSDAFKWVLLICIGYQCFEIKEYREYHKLPSQPDYKTLKKWICDNGELGSHDGDLDYLALFAGTYNDYQTKSEKDKK